MFQDEHSSKELHTRRGFVGLSAAFVAAIATGNVYASALTSSEMQRIKQDWHMHTYRAGGKPDAIVADIIKTNEE